MPKFRCLNLLVCWCEINQYSIITFIFFQKFKKALHPLRVNEIALSSANAFVVDLFALGSENASRYDEKNHFWWLPVETWLVFNPFKSFKRH